MAEREALQTGGSKVEVDGGKHRAEEEERSRAREQADGDADATISVNWDDFLKISQGAMDPTMAFMQGKLKVLGDMSVAMQLQGLMKKLG